MSASLSGAARALGRPDRLPWVLGAMHAVVDTATVSVVVSTSYLHELPVGRAFTLILAYDVIAFGAQSVIGLGVDRVARPRVALGVGLVLTAACVAVLPVEPTAAMLLAASGNALFHVGAGALTLCSGGGRAAPSGIFVAPGALGLGLGTWLGRQGVYEPWPIYVALALCAAASLALREPATYGVVSQMPLSQRLAGPGAVGRVSLVVGLLLFSIVVRSFVGIAGTADCPRSAQTLVALSLAAFGGKALGGIVGDRLGWIPVSVGALVVSAPLIAFGGGALYLVAPGMFLFQMTMPVTLSAVALVLPRRPALAFGLTCLALVVGILPTFTSAFDDLYRPETFLAAIGLSALCLAASLRAIRGARPVAVAPG